MFFDLGRCSLWLCFFVSFSHSCEFWGRSLLCNCVLHFGPFSCAFFSFTMVLALVTREDSCAASYLLSLPRL